MPHKGKSKAQSEAGEFSDFTDSVESEVEEVLEDNWVFPVLGPNAKRQDFQEVSHSEYSS
jgi:hypothetical protein